MPKLTKASELALRIPGFISFAPWGRLSVASRLFRESKTQELAWVRYNGLTVLAVVNQSGEILRLGNPIEPHEPTTRRTPCWREGCILHNHPKDVPHRSPVVNLLPESPNEKLVGSAVRP